MNTIQRITGKLYRITSKGRNLRKMKKLGLQFLPPNYIYFKNFNEQSVVVDVGCGFEAEFSILMIEKYNLNAYGIDPTVKHAASLKALEERTKSKFHHLALAVTKKDGFIKFHESKQNESGSILLEHINIQKDDITSYDVESVSLRKLVRRIGTTPVDFLKLDLEGAEYELLDNISDEDINPFKQIFIEFHHHCTNHSSRETKSLVKNICSKGFKMFTLDRKNYLFYK